MGSTSQVQLLFQRENLAHHVLILRQVADFIRNHTPSLRPLQDLPNQGDFHVGRPTRNTFGLAGILKRTKAVSRELLAWPHRNRTDELARRSSSRAGQHTPAWRDFAWLVSADRSLETRAYRPARNIFAGFRAWPQTLPDSAFGQARLAAISERHPTLAAVDPCRRPLFVGSPRFVAG
jgi:hypothetical protein